MNTRTITKHVLYLAGASLSMTTINSCTPVANKKPSQEVIGMYIDSKGHYNAHVSEQRKQEIQNLLNQIKSIRSQIRVQAKSLEMNHDVADKLLTSIAARSMEKTSQKDYKLADKSQYIHLNNLPNYLKADIIRRRKGMMVIDMEELVNS